jgi:hypothetical protein
MKGIGLRLIIRHHHSTILECTHAMHRNWLKRTHPPPLSQVERFSSGTYHETSASRCRATQPMSFYSLSCSSVAIDCTPSRVWSLPLPGPAPSSRALQLGIKLPGGRLPAPIDLLPRIVLRRRLSAQAVFVLLKRCEPFILADPHGLSVDLPQFFDLKRSESHRCARTPALLAFN